MKKILLVSLFVCIPVFLLIGRHVYSTRDYTKDYTEDTQNLNPEQIIEYYFDARNMKNERKRDAVLSTEAKMRSQSPDYSRNIRIISIETVDTINIDESSFRYSLESHLNEVVTLRVEYHVKWQRRISSQVEDTFDVIFYIGRETNADPWLIHGMERAQNYFEGET